MNRNYPRTLYAIYLRPEKTARGGHELMDLNTGNVVTRQVVKEVPVTAVVVKAVEALAERDDVQSLKITNRAGVVLHDADLEYDTDEDDEEDGQHQDRALQRRDVPPEDGVIQKEPGARPVEHGLDQDRPAEQVAELDGRELAVGAGAAVGGVHAAADVPEGPGHVAGVGLVGERFVAPELPGRARGEVQVEPIGERPDFDPSMAALVAERGVPAVLMHSRGRFEELHRDPAYRDVAREVVAELGETVARGGRLALGLVAVLLAMPAAAARQAAYAERLPLKASRATTTRTARPLSRRRRAPSARRRGRRTRGPGSRSSGRPR